MPINYHKLTKILSLLFIFLLISCGSEKSATDSNNAFSDSKVVKWRKQQNKKILEMTFKDVDNFYALGIGTANNWSIAEENAKFDADITLGSLIESYVKTINTTYTEEKIKSGESNSINEESLGMIYSKSVTFLKDTKYTLLDKYELNDKKFVAIAVIKNKKDYFNDYMRIAQPSNSEIIQKVFDKAEDNYRLIVEDINTKKNKK
jgi:hypothetical protein